MNREQVVEYLRAERDRLDSVIAVLEAKEGHGEIAGKEAGNGRHKARRKISAAGLARIRAAQKARWAKQRKNKG